MKTNQKFLYNRNALKCFRIIAAICLTLLSISTIDRFRLKIFPMLYNNTFPAISEFIGICVNIFVIFLLLFILLFPEKFEFSVVIAYFYSIEIILFEPSNYMGIILYFLGIIILLARGRFKKNIFLSLLISVLFLFLLLITYSRFGISYFLDYFISSVAVIIVLLLYSFFLLAYERNTLIVKNNKLNISEYEGLTERDCTILRRIQQGIKYSIIAKEQNITEGTLKNRLHFVFNCLEVGDRQGFISIYGNYEILFEDSNKSDSDIY